MPLCAWIPSPSPHCSAYSCSSVARLPDLDRLFDDLAAPSGLTRANSTFGRRDVVPALAARLPSHMPISARTLETLSERYLASDRVVALLPAGADPETRPSCRRQDGRVLPVAREEWVYSTPGLLTLEQRLLKSALAGRSVSAGLADAAAVRRAVSSRSTLSEDRRTMVERLCLGRDRIAVVVGKAGAGKTFALAAARETWQASELPVLGVAVARRAVNQLAADAGVATTSIAALIADLDQPVQTLPHRAVLVVRRGQHAGDPPARCGYRDRRYTSSLAVVAYRSSESGAARCSSRRRWSSGSPQTVAPSD